MIRRDENKEENVILIDKKSPVDKSDMTLITMEKLDIIIFIIEQKRNFYSS